MTDYPEIKTREFTAIVGETYDIVRNRYGRSGSEPRLPGPLADAEADAIIHRVTNRHRRYVFADALAWHFARALSGHSLDWDTAAEILRRERPADYLMGEFGERGQRCGQVFAVWRMLPHDESGPKWAAHLGQPSEIAMMIEHDHESCDIPEVLMVSCDEVLRKATVLAEAAGYQVIGEQLVKKSKPEEGAR